ncbi:RepB family plasmid replication initiator protein [Campylobacter sp. RM16192]|uniref:RepB family plasmid replication initiator protein n=1 Tax=Campylobacter sp. RM16192 TaxID=1660080 RepID=UPI0015987C13|nr:RepB family plasmid replication initiator protein [Campylobacter sp. RM16192]QKU36215.1 plasmid replication protein [Campylobacter sp. RM16192]
MEFKGNESISTIDNDVEFKKILKANSVIRGWVVNPANLKEKPKQLSLYEKRVLNFLLKCFQQCYRNNPESLREFNTIVFPFELFKNTVDDNADYRRKIKNALHSLNTKSFVLKDFIEFGTGKRLGDYTTTLVNSFSVYQEDKNMLRVTIPAPLAGTCCQKLGYYTHLDFKTINSFTRKYALNLYEYLVSKIQFFSNERNFKDEISFKIDELENIFEFKSSELKDDYTLNSLLADKKLGDIMDSIKETINLKNYEVLSKDLKLVVLIDKDVYLKFQTMPPDVVDLALEKFSNLIDADVSYPADNQVVFTLDKTKMIDTMANFLNILAKNCPNQLLLDADEDKVKYGDIAVNSKGDFYYLRKDASMPLIKYKQKKKILNFLYKNHYERLMKKCKQTIVLDAECEELQISIENQERNDIAETIKYFIGRKLYSAKADSTFEIVSLSVDDKKSIEGEFKILAGLINIETKQEVHNSFNSLEQLKKTLEKSRKKFEQDANLFDDF